MRFLHLILAEILTKPSLFDFDLQMTIKGHVIAFVCSYRLSRGW